MGLVGRIGIKVPTCHLVDYPRSGHHLLNDPQSVPQLFKEMGAFRGHRGRALARRSFKDPRRGFCSLDDTRIMPLGDMEM